MIKITFPDGSVREYNEGVTGLQIAESISSRLAQDVLACGVNGEIYDLGRPIMQDAVGHVCLFDVKSFPFSYSLNLFKSTIVVLYPYIV
jgi:hypothetical protein